MTNTVSVLTRTDNGRFIKTHGLSKKSPAWFKWMDMRARCRNRNYSWVCERWEKFEAFLDDMGEPPPGFILDRKENADGYHPGNCRWVTPKQSTENRRNTVWVTINGDRIRVSDFAARYGMPEARVYARLARGWAPEKIAVTPPRECRWQVKAVLRDLEMGERDA